MVTAFLKSGVCFSATLLLLSACTNDTAGSLPAGDAAAPEAGCIPACGENECGDNGCGDVCGYCPEAAPFCVSGKCKTECEPDCAGKECGDNGCGGSCGECPEAAPFCVDSKCSVECEPQCDDKECGQDGCGDLCGECPEAAPMCIGGKCEVECEPGCAGKVCGSDGCGGSCGQCGCGEACEGGQCAYVACELIECGDDGCGASCGDCGCGEACDLGKCVFHNCDGKQCGPDGCGGSCGECPDDGLKCTDDFCQNDACVSVVDVASCVVAGQCFAAYMQSPGDPCQACVPKTSQEAWSPLPDGAICSPGKVCHLGLCCDHATNCQGKPCGDDGCGGTCGQCPEDALDCTDTVVCQGGDCVYPIQSVFCVIDGVCVASGELHLYNACLKCDPNASQDSWTALADATACPGSDQHACVAGECVCVPACDGKECGDDGCGDVCGVCDDGIACTDDLCQEGQCSIEVQPTFCLIGGECVPEGTEKPGNPCQTCQPTESTSFWTPIPDSTPCPGGEQWACVSGGCFCVPECVDKECGNDGCGGECGGCGFAQGCVAWKCAPQLAWAYGFGGTDFDRATSTAVSSEGNLYVAGFFQSPTISVGGDQLLNDTGENIVFVAQYDEHGEHAWSKAFLTLSDTPAPKIAAAPAGGFLLTSWLSSSSTELDGVPLAAYGQTDILLASMNDAGETAWFHTFGGASYDFAGSVSVGQNGNIALAGQFRSDSINFGGNDLINSVPNEDDVFLALFDMYGNHLWSKVFASPGFDSAWAVAVGPGGSVAVAGNFQNGIDFGGGQMDAADIKDVYVAQFDGAGDFQWSARIYSNGDDYAESLSISPDGHVHVTGGLMGQNVDFGQGLVQTAAEDTVFIAKLDSQDGSVIWASLLQATGRGTSITNDAVGNTYVGGYFNSVVADFGGGQFVLENDDVSGSTGDVFIAAFAPNGNHLWSTAFGGPAPDLCESVTVGASGAVFAVGQFRADSIDIGGTVLTNNGQGADDIFVLKFDQ